MQIVERGLAAVNGTHIHYEATGAGDPLLLIHGTTLDRRMWDAQLAAFAAGFRVIRCDLRGFGLSAPPTDAPYAHEDDVRALLAHLGALPAHLVGLSLGGRIAIDLALAHPHDVRSLVAVDAAVGGHRWSPAFSAALDDVFRRGRQHGIEAAKSSWLEHPIFATVRARPAAWPAVVRMVTDYSGWHFVNPDPIRAAAPPAAHRLADLHAPTLAVVGEHDFPDFHAIADLIATAPCARKRVLEGAGHLPPMEAPEAFNALVLQFLADLDLPA